MGDHRKWVELPVNKSLFTVTAGYGLPIGNITSQMIANFLLDDADHYLSETLGLTIDRYVDDTATVDCDRERLLSAMPVVRKYLRESDVPPPCVQQACGRKGRGLLQGKCRAFCQQHKLLPWFYAPRERIRNAVQVLQSHISGLAQIHRHK